MFEKIITTLTRPSASLLDESDRQRAILLSALIIPFLMILPLGTVITTNEVERRAVGGLFLIAIAVYVFSRTRYYHVAGGFFSVALFFPPYISLFHTPEYSQLIVLGWFSWMNLPILLSSMWLKLRFVFALWTINLVFAGTLPLTFVPWLDYGDLVIAWCQLFVFGALIQLSAYIRNGYLDRLHTQADELRLARDQAESGNRAKTIFLANMSHELRTPLHGILGFAQLGSALKGDAPAEKSQKYFSQINLSGQRLLTLLNDLLDLNKLESGSMEMNFYQDDIAVLVQNCVESQSAVLKEKGVKVVYRVEGDLPLVEVDNVRIGQVVLNILTNAIKFSPNGSEITINVELSTEKKSSQPRVKVCIADQGPGVPEEELSFIFRKFAQSRQNDYTNGGTGLGLAISREIIQAHNGRIWCENRKDMSGTIFCFLLPVVQEAVS